MPRKDKTFSDKDVIRIFVKHLTAKERLNVVLFVLDVEKDVIRENLAGINKILLDILDYKDTIQGLLNAFAFLPVVGQIIDIVDIFFELVEEALKQTAQE